MKNIYKSKQTCGIHVQFNMNRYGMNYSMRRVIFWAIKQSMKNFDLTADDLKGGIYIIDTDDGYETLHDGNDNYNGLCFYWLGRIVINVKHLKKLPIKKYLTKLVGTIAHEMRHMYQYKTIPTCFNGNPDIKKIESKEGPEAAYAAWAAIPTEIDAIAAGDKMSELFLNGEAIKKW